MAGVAEDEVVGGGEVGEQQGGGEAAGFGEAGELAVELARQVGHVEEVDVLLHQLAEAAGDVADVGAVAGDVGHDEAGDAAGAAGRDVVDVTAELGAFVGLAEDPGVEAGDFEDGGDGGVAAPDFHALDALGVGAGGTDRR